VGIINDLGLNENMTKEQISEQLFNVRKKLITRQNSADIQKRSQAELQLDIVSSMQNAINKMNDSFDVHVLVATYGFAADNDKLNKDLKEAIEVAASGNGDSAGRIADFVGNNGQNQLRDKWMFQAADCGAVNAYQVCGYLLTDTDPDKAIFWFEKANEANVISASNIYNWGLILYRRKEYVQAKEKFERASAEGHAMAPYFIAEMYENGYGVAQDLRKALEQYQLAKQRGLQEAQQGITRVATTLNQQNAANLNQNKPNNNSAANNTRTQQVNNVQNGQPTLVFKSDRKSAIPYLEDINIDNLKEKLKADEIASKVGDMAGKVGDMASGIAGKVDKDKVKKLPWKKIIIGLVVLLIAINLFKSCASGIASLGKKVNDTNVSQKVEKQEKENNIEVVEQADEGIGTKLSKVNIIESNEFGFAENSVLDTVGFSYSGNNIGLLSASSKYDGYVRFNIGENDKYLQGVISVSDETNSLRSGKIQVLTGRAGSMNLVYESDTLSRIDEPFLLSIDVANADTAEIRFAQTDNNGYSYKEYIILADVRLYEESQNIELPSRDYLDGQKLSEFKVSLADNYSTSVENPTDTVGNSYDTNNLSMISMNSSNDGYACYFVDGNYKYISGIFAPQADSNSIRSGIFIVYAYIDNDWVEVYESDTITRTSKASVFSADISGASWVEVVYRHTDNNGYSYAGNLLLSEVAFYKNELPNIEVPATAGEEILPLNKLNIVQCDGFNFATEKQYDTVGNTYMGSNVANIASASSFTGYVDYYLGGNYKYLAGVVASNDESNNIRKGVLRVFTKNEGDWEFVYESPSISRVIAPFELVADVGNAEWMRIEFVNTDNNGYSYKSYAILSDMTLYANDNYSVDVPKVNFKESCLLSDLKVAKCDGFSESKESLQDFLGNKYMGKNIETIQSDGYVYYFVDGSYNTISGKIVPRNDSNEIRTCHFMIYKKSGDNDWELAYESEDMTNSTGIINYEVDITGADWIYLEYKKVDNKGYSYKAYGILSENELK